MQRTSPRTEIGFWGETDELVFVLVHGSLGQQLRGFRIKSDAGIAGRVVGNHESIIVNNPRQDWRFSLEVDREFGFSTRSIVSVPLMSQDRLIGVIQLLNKHDGQFTGADVALLLVLGQVAVTVLEAVQS